MNLSEMQKRYIWLMGSFPKLQMFQGQGIRLWRKTQGRLCYAVTEDELFIFGYSNPPYFMVGKWLDKGQAPNSYNLNKAGQDAFNAMLASGGLSSDCFKLMRLK